MDLTSTKSNRPSIDSFELNSLADLFEEESPDINQNWQEEEIIVDDTHPSSGQSFDALFPDAPDSTSANLDDFDLDSLLTDAVPEAKATQNGHNKEEDDSWLFGTETPTNGKTSPTTATKTVSDDSNELIDLFGEDFFSEAPTPIKVEPERQKTTTTVQNADFNDLFGDLADETPIQKISPKSVSVDTDIDLEDLFTDLEVTPSPSTKSTTTQTVTPPSVIVTTATVVDPQLLPPEGGEEIEYFVPLDELERLIDTKIATIAELTQQFAQLSDVIIAPVTQLAIQSEVKAEAVTPPKVQPVVAAPITKEEEDEFDDLADLLKQADLTMGGPPTVSTTAQNKGIQRGGRKQGSSFEQTMRVPVKQLDSLNNLMGELVVNRNTLEQGQERMRQFLDNLQNHVQKLSDVGGRMQDLYERSLLESSLLASRQKHLGGSSSHSGRGGNMAQFGHAQSHHQTSNDQEYDPLEMDRFTGFHLLSQEMIELIVRVRESSSDIQFLVENSLENITRNLRQVSAKMSEGLNQSRMVPFAQTADRLPRAVREISLKLNKKAELQVEGRETLIDKLIDQSLFDPMTHLVNNAITHGIETPDIRESRGKPPIGKITIKASQQGNQTVITVSDDGAGMDSHKIKAKAIEKGLITKEEASKLSRQELFEFIFHPGFSTKDQADDFAGRGVGMDVVLTNLSALRGTITTDSKLGQGTTFTIRLPQSLRICKALCCLSDHARIAFPMDGVEDMQDFPASTIDVQPNGTKIVHWRDLSLPFQPLNKLLGYNRKISRGSLYGGTKDEDQVSIVFLRSAGSLLAVQVDQVIGEQEIVIKQIEGPLPKPPGIAGATVLGDGSVMPIADVLELIEIAQGTRRAEHSNAWVTSSSKPAAEARTEPMVLIVDDSITVRELLSLTFNKSGYRVEQARDGQEAWEKLRSGLPCSLVFCDIEMPRMNGLELLGKIQKDEHLCDLPVAMLTSRGAEKHRQEAAQLGASAYFTKPYLEEMLLDSAQRMLKGEVLLDGSTRIPKLKSEVHREQSTLTGKETIIQERPPNLVQAKPKARSQPHVLIIDDSVTVRELLSMTFRNAGYKVEQARDGKDAWDKLQSDFDFDLVFCDIEMPRMDGLELLSQIQQDVKLNQLPVAMLTSRGAEKHRRIAAERGARGYFTKPYVEETLLNAAKRLISGEVLLDDDGQIVV